MRLYHYTCSHGHDSLGAGGLLQPGSTLAPQLNMPWMTEFVWLTDMAVPERDALGLTMRVTRCDRMRYRYRVADDNGVLPWTVVARTLHRGFRDEVESAPGVRPAHWFVSRSPVPAVLDPGGMKTRRSEAGFGSRGEGVSWENESGPAGASTPVIRASTIHAKESDRRG